MATNSRPRRALEARSGGKIVRARRTAGPRTPYDRPRLTNLEPENPSWISKLIFSPTRAVASGAGKLISAVFSQDDSSSSSSSSSESDSSLEENVANYYDDDGDDDDISSHGADILNESNEKSEIIKGFKKDLEPKMGKRDSKRAIEELLMQQTFTREEGNKLIKIIKARVVDGYSTKGAETGGVIEIPGETSGEADKQALRCTAVMEAKKWLSEKKLRSASKSDMDDFIGEEAGSPVDMAKLYMRTRPLWASPTFKHGEFSSPSPVGTHLFKEETPYSIGTSSIKAKRDTPTTGSWNIQEEIQKVRVKATEEMLRNLPSKNIDWPFRASPISLLAKNMDASIGEKVDASLLTAQGLRGTHRFQGMEIASDGLRNEASSLNRVNITSEQNQDLEATNVVDGEGGKKDGLEVTVCKEHGLHSSQDIEARTSLSDGGVNVCNHKDTSANEKQLSPIAEGSIQVPDARSLERNHTTSKEVAGNESAHTSNGLPPSGYSLSTETVSKQDAMLDGEDNDPVGSGYDKTDDGVFEDESCELLSEASVEVPYVSNDDGNENDHITNGSPNVAQRYSTRQGLKRSLAPNATGDVEKQQGKRPSKYNRRKQGISTQ